MFCDVRPGRTGGLGSEWLLCRGYRGTLKRAFRGSLRGTLRGTLRRTLRGAHIGALRGLLCIQEKGGRPLRVLHGLLGTTQSF